MLDRKNKKNFIILSSVLAIFLIISACAPLTAIANLPFFEDQATGETDQRVEIPEQYKKQSDNLSNPDSVSVAAIEGTLSSIYEQVSPSVVNIQVSSSTISTNIFPSDPTSPQIPEFQSALGSGFVWNDEGYIVTNNHVVEDASAIEVVFSDGSSYEAELIGADSDSDLAVIKIDAAQSILTPVTFADSNNVKVGDIAIAIGNPYGLGGTMTTGIISALGRSLQADDSSLTGSYTIPDIIQTDAAINPGNSGGVLLNSNGEVIGVTTAIQSPVEANVGIGFVIPSAIVQNVVPELIEHGFYEHSYLGISGMSLFPEIALAMDLERNQRGIMVSTVVKNGPAGQAGILPSEKTYKYQGIELNIGGDIITAIDGIPTPTFDDLVSYLASSTRPGQDVTLDILRGGESRQVTVTLQARPRQQQETVQATQPPTGAFASGQAYLGIAGGSLVPEVAEAMGLDPDQEGVLVVEIVTDSPAEEAGLIGSDQPFTLDGQELMIGGDVIIRINRTQIDGIQALREELLNYSAGDVVTLTILRDGERMEVEVTLGERP